jgi:hypothetical protein
MAAWVGRGLAFGQEDATDVPLAYVPQGTHDSGCLTLADMLCWGPPSLGPAGEVGPR